MMNLKPGFAILLAGSFLLPMAAVHADEVDQAHPMNYLKDSAITTAIKSKLAAEHFKSLKNIKVDTDDQGIVWLSGSVSTDYQVHQAELISRQTDGVRDVKNHIVIRPDD